MTETALTVWTVYRRPADYPTKWVLRTFTVTRGAAGARSGGFKTFARRHHSSAATTPAAWRN